MVDPQTGFAPARWAKNIGEVSVLTIILHATWNLDEAFSPSQVTIVRADQQPLSVTDLENFFVYCNNVLSMFTLTLGEGPNPSEAYTNEAFQYFVDQYCEACFAAKQQGVALEDLDYTDGPVPLFQIPEEATTNIAASDPRRGLQWLDIGPMARLRTRRYPGTRILPNGQVGDSITFIDDTF
ncbi:hypothetical protein EIP86_003725 [Pleurotus ostreatoroseus]|nr:hypothetical protein EIP86_003725 [Pleurotus ostreatoroseus]